MTTRFSWSKAFRKVLRKQLNHSDSDPHIDCLTSKKREGGGGGATAATPTVNGSDDGAAPSPPPSFAAAWVARELARQGADLEDVIAAACSEGGSGADAGALRAAAQRARDQAGGDPAAALAILAACCRAHEEQEVVKPVVPHDGWLLGAPKPACHAQRVQTADKINQMRATRDGEIESMLRLLCTIFDTDTATCALLTGECIYIVAGCGALYPCVCPDRWGFCGWSFLNSVHEMLVIEDMDTDARFAANYFVTDPQFHLKFYVAAPLVSADGHRLGTLCVMGNQARRFDATRAQVLANLAEMMVRQLEKRWALQLAAMSDVEGAVQMLRPLEAYDTPYLVVDTSVSPWRVLHMNIPAIDALGVEWSASYQDLASHQEQRPCPKFEGRAISEVFDLSGATANWRQGGWEFDLMGVAGAAGSVEMEGRRFSLHFRLCHSDGLDAAQPAIGIPSFVSLCSDGFGRSLFFVRIEEDPTSSVMHLLRKNDLGATAAAAADGAPALAKAALGVAMRDDSAGWLPPLAIGDDGAGAPAGGCGGGSDNGSSSGALSSSLLAAWTPRTSSSGGCIALASGSPSSSFSSSLGTVPRSVASSLGGGCPIEGLLLGPLLGKGSYGRVHRGIYKGQPVAVKIIDNVNLITRDSHGDPLEFALTRDLGHPNLMRTVACGFGDASGAPGGVGGKRGGAHVAGRQVCWMVFEYADKGTLVDAVVKGWFRTDRDPTISATDLRRVAVAALEVAGALAYLHARGVLHGDLCGGNVLLQSPPTGSPGFTVKIGDFGLVRRLWHASSPSSTPTQAPLRVNENSYGTVTHVAPETLLEGTLTPASDVYSFGVLLQEMLTGTRAWAGLSHTAVIIQTSVLGRSLEVPAGLPATVKFVLEKCLAREPGERPSFAEVAGMLAGWLQETKGDDLSGTEVGRRLDVESKAVVVGGVPA